jgi:hypothetical protein
MVVVCVRWMDSSSLGLSEWTSRSGHLPPGAWRRSEDQEPGEYNCLWAGVMVQMVIVGSEGWGGSGSGVLLFDVNMK